MGLSPYKVCLFCLESRKETAEKIIKTKMWNYMYTFGHYYRPYKFFFYFVLKVKGKLQRK